MARATNLDGADLMPFLQAGFNGRHYATGIAGWTRHVRGGRFAPARLICFEGGDYAWRGDGFLSWGDYVVLGSWGIDLPYEYSHDRFLPRCDIDTREEHEGIDWGRYR